MVPEPIVTSPLEHTAKEEPTTRNPPKTYELGRLIVARRERSQGSYGWRGYTGHVESQY